MDVHRANRFSPLTAEIDDEPVSGVPPPIGVVGPVHQVGESDTDSVEFHAIHTPGASHGSESGDVVPFERPNDPSDTVLDEVPVTRATRAGFASLDRVDLMTMFRSRACIMKSPPHFLRRAYRSAMRLALDEIELGTAAGDDRRRCRQGWKLFVLLPQMLLFKPARGGLVPKSRLLARFSAFSNGDWEQFLIASRECAEAAVQVRSRRRRTRVPTVDQRADRAEQLVHLGELSAARMALEGDPIAPGNDATLQALQDPRKRPAVPREPLPREVLEHQPEGVIELDQERLCGISEAPDEVLQEGRLA